MRVLALMLALFLPLPVQGQEVNFDPSTIEPCIEQGGWIDCIGLAANACMDETDGGHTTLGMVACIAQETAWWDGDLKATYNLILQRDLEDDSTFVSDPGMEARPSMADAIREIHSGWPMFRDASCRYEELRWWGGSGARLAGAGCILRMTGEQALRMRSYLAEG